MILFLTFPTKKLLGKGFQKVLLDRLGGSSVFRPDLFFHNLCGRLHFFFQP